MKTAQRIRGRLRPVLALGALSALLLSGAGCASHSNQLAAVRGSLVAGDITEALAQFDKAGGKDDDVLHLMEKGILLHVSERWEESNEALEAVETRQEDLYTRSISREAAALLTSDLARPYRALPYEIELVAYYRALNYMALGQLDEALVEARKANYLLSLNDPEEAAETRRPTAFMQYVTGLLYEAAGEANDAIVSLRDAHAAYQTSSTYAAPRWLAGDYYAVASHLGASDDVEKLRTENPAIAEEARSEEKDNIVIFFESGFVPHRESVDIVLPILDYDERDEHKASRRYVDHYGRDIYSHTYNPYEAKLDHVLRFAFPRLQPNESRVVTCELELPDGSIVHAAPALDLEAVAAEDFSGRIPGILAKTVVRALAKELTRKGVKKENEVLGWVLNAVNVATEQADTRSAILLPRRIDLVKAQIPPGTNRVKARFLDSAGGIVDEWTLTIDSSETETHFASVRSFH